MQDMNVTLLCWVSQQSFHTSSAY